MWPNVSIDKHKHIHIVSFFVSIILCKVLQLSNENSLCFHKQPGLQVVLINWRRVFSSSVSWITVGMFFLRGVCLKCSTDAYFYNQWNTCLFFHCHWDNKVMGVLIGQLLIQLQPIYHISEWLQRFKQWNWRVWEICVTCWKVVYGYMETTCYGNFLLCYDVALCSLTVLCVFVLHRQGQCGPTDFSPLLLHRHAVWIADHTHRHTDGHLSQAQRDHCFPSYPPSPRTQT